MRPARRARTGLLGAARPVEGYRHLIETVRGSAADRNSPPARRFAGQMPASRRKRGLDRPKQGGEAVQVEMDEEFVAAAGWMRLCCHLVSFGPHLERNCLRPIRRKKRHELLEAILRALSLQL